MEGDFIGLISAHSPLLMSNCQCNVHTHIYIHSTVSMPISISRNVKFLQSAVDNLQSNYPFFRVANKRKDIGVH